MTYEEEQTQDGATPTTDCDEAEFERLCQRLADAKDAEAKAAAKRLDAERALLAFVPARDEGSVTVNRGAWKVTASFPVNRTIDAAALESIRTALDPSLFESAITYKPALVLPGLRSLQSNHPEAYALLAQAITAKPGKPGVKIEPNKES